MHPIYRIIAAFLIGPVLYMSVAFTMFRTECLHTGHVAWEVFEAVDCLEMEEQHSQVEQVHACCKKKEKCHASEESGKESAIKKKCCTNTLINGYVEVESLIDEPTTILPVHFIAAQISSAPTYHAENSGLLNLALSNRPPPKSIAQQLSLLQVYRL